MYPSAICRGNFPGFRSSYSRQAGGHCVYVLPRCVSGKLLYEQFALSSGREARSTLVSVADVACVEIPGNFRMAANCPRHCTSPVRSLRSQLPIELHRWHRIRVSRTGRLAFLEVDGQPAQSALGPGAFNELSLGQNLYVGGVPTFRLVSPYVPVRRAMRGCVQKVPASQSRKLPRLRDRFQLESFLAAAVAASDRGSKLCRRRAS